MKDLKSLLIFLAILVVAGITIWVAVAKNAANQNQTSQSEQNYTVSSDLDSLDATDLDSGFDSQVEQLNSDSSSL